MLGTELSLAGSTNVPASTGGSASISSADALRESGRLSAWPLGSRGETGATQAVFLAHALCTLEYLN